MSNWISKKKFSLMMRNIKNNNLFDVLARHIIYIWPTYNFEMVPLTVREGVVLWLL